MENYLAQVPLFQSLPAAARRKLSELCELRRFHRGEIIFKEQHPAEFVWVIRRGLVHLVKRTPHDGVATIFAMTPDEALCGVSAFERGTYSAGAIAATDTQIVKIPGEAFSQLLGRYPKFSEAVLLACCHRMRQMAAMISLSQAPVEQRLAHVLLRLRATFGDTVPITHQELARMAQTRWETSIRTLSRLRRKGWVSTDRGKVRILHPDQLQALLDMSHRTRNGVI